MAGEMHTREGVTDQATTEVRPVGPTMVGRHRRVLVAEDDASLRRMIAAVLRGDGYDVVEAGDGLELLGQIEAILAGGRARSDEFVILADVNMPGLTGMDVLAILRCASAAPAVILMTAFGDREVHAEARELGAAAVLDKPFNLDTLRAIVVEAGPSW
jgi:CheY-like chemotaxis protein